VAQGPRDSRVVLLAVGSRPSVRRSAHGQAGPRHAAAFGHSPMAGLAAPAFRPRGRHAEALRLLRLRVDRDGFRQRSHRGGISPAIEPGLPGICGVSGRLHVCSRTHDPAECAVFSGLCTPPCSQALRPQPGPTSSSVRGPTLRRIAPRPAVHEPSRRRGRPAAGLVPTWTLDAWRCTAAHVPDALPGACARHQYGGV
jgi:hypothetical protein